MGVGYAAVDERGGVSLVVDKATLDELLDVTTDDLNVVVGLFTEVDDAFVAVVDIFVVDAMRFSIPFGVGAPLTLTARRRSSTEKLNVVAQVEIFMATESADYENA